MFQGHVSDPTGSNINGIWVDPMRDIAHNVPLLIKNALLAMEHDIDSLVDETARESVRTIMGTYAQTLAKFIKLCNGPSRPLGDSAKYEALKQSGLLDAPDSAQRLFGKWMTRAILGAYFMGIGYALHKNDTPIGVQDLLEIIDGYPNTD